MCDVANLIKLRFYLLYPTFMVHGNPQEMDALLRKDSSNFVSDLHKVSISPSAILSKSPDLFVIELIFRYNNTFLRLNFPRRFSITLMFSSLTFFNAIWGKPWSLIYPKKFFCYRSSASEILATKKVLKLN